MRKYLIIFLFGCFLQPLTAQESDQLQQHHLSADLGSVRNRYFYPISDLKYNSPLIGNTGFRISARLRSYGTLFFINKNTYDLTLLAEYYFIKEQKPVYFSAGLGTDIRLRFVNDERSEAESSAEPLVSLTAHANFRKFCFNLPLWTRFYSNGISFTVLPEASYRIDKRFSVYFRYEMSYLQVYKIQNHEWRRDCFTGVTFYF